MSPLLREASGAHAADTSGAHPADMERGASEASGANASEASKAHIKAPLRALLALARARKRGQEDKRSAEDKKQARAQKEKQARLLLARKRGRPVGSKNKKSSGRDMAAGMEGEASEASGAQPVNRPRFSDRAASALAKSELALAERTWKASEASRARPADMDEVSRARRAELSAAFRARVVVGGFLAEEAGMEGGASEASGAHPAGMQGRVSGVRKRGPPVGSKHSKPRKKAHGGDIYLRLLVGMEGGASKASGARPVEDNAVLLVDQFLAEADYAL